MKLFCCYTPAHEALFENYFRPSLPASFSMQAFPLPIEGKGDFLSQEFLQCIRKKVELIRQSIFENEGDTIVWSDVDLLFFGDVVPEIQNAFRGETHMLFQAEARRGTEVNTGLMAIKCGSETAGFFSRMAERLALETDKNEQAVANEMLSQERSVKWSYLSSKFYARTHGWPPPRNICVYHANYTKGSDAVRQKIQQFEELIWMRKFGPPALAWSCLKRLPGKITRSLWSSG